MVHSAGTVIIDTESIGFLGDPVLIQYGDVNTVDKSQVTLWETFTSPIGYSIDLLERLASKHNVFYNAPFDIHKLAMFYNKLKALSRRGVSDSVLPVDILDEYYSLTCAECISYCYNPVGITDLMVSVRESPLQEYMRQDNVRIRKVPLVVADMLRAYLEENLVIPDIFFSGAPSKRREKGTRWQIKLLKEDGEEEITPTDKCATHPTLCNLYLKLDPRSGLKPLAKYILGFEDTTDIPLPAMPEEDGVSHWLTDYKSYARLHIEHWAGKGTHGQDPRDYAARDIIYTAALYRYMDSGSMGLKPCGETNHRLSVLVGNTHWSGFSLDLERAETERLNCLESDNRVKDIINYRSPKQVKDYLLGVADPFFASDIDEKGTGTPILKSLRDDADEELAKRMNMIITARSNYLRMVMLEKFLRGERLFCSYKVVGTKSNRMAGGGTDGGINPQGIPSVEMIRACVTGADDGEVLIAGDFDSFEVSIMDALYDDNNLRTALQSGKKFHALYGTHLYNMSYEELCSPENEYYYKKAKIAVFAGAYGAEEDTIARQTGTHVEDARRANKLFQEDFPGIGRAKLSVKQTYNPIKSLGKGKTEFTPPTPVDGNRFVESMFGFRRYLNFEYMLAEFFYNLSTNLPNSFRTVGASSGVSMVVRKGKLVDIATATKAALFGTCFSICGRIQRAAGNHLIQSPGGQITKELQVKLWKQPTGCKKWEYKVMNVHDEVLVVTKPDSITSVEETLKTFLEDRRKFIPLIGMKLKVGKNWAEVH